jgi:uncharacterized protein YggE
MRKVLSVIAAAFCAVSFQAQADGDCSQLNGRMDIYGSGSVEIMPDEARLNFSVISKEKNVKDAYAKCEEHTGAFQKALKAMDIKKEDVIAGSVTVEPVYEYDEKQKKQVLQGYEARRSLTVKTADFSKISLISDEAVKNGVNSVEGFEYGLKDESKARAQADEKAIADARAQAQRLSEGFGVKLLKPCSLNFERQNDHIRPVYRLMSVNAAAVAPEAAAPQPRSEYSPDKIVIRSGVRAVFAIE